MKSYRGSVQIVTTRLLLLIAVLFLPLGMNTAPAAAATHHGPMTTMAMHHCPEQAPKQQPKGGIAECTMACASALPAMDRASEADPPTVHLALMPLPERPLHGLHPDTATPPPKAS